MMDQIMLRFPHLAEQIYGELDNLSLVNCKEVSLSWCHFLNNNKASNVQVIKGYTNCSDALIKKLAKNSEDVIQIASDLHKIFENFRREITQSIFVIKDNVKKSHFKTHWVSKIPKHNFILKKIKKNNKAYFKSWLFNFERNLIKG